MCAITTTSTGRSSSITSPARGCRGGGAALTVNQSFAYSPSYLYGLFATVAPAVGNFIAPAGDYALNDQRSYASATTARITETIGTRGLLSFDSGLRYTKFTSTLPG